MDALEKQKYIFGSLFLLANKLQTIGDKYLGEAGMTTKQWFLTVMISQFHDNPPTLSEVAELMGTSHQNVKQLALKLEEKGMLNIDKDERDSRALRLKLSDKSKIFWEKREERDNNFIVELFKECSEAEIEAMCSCFDKLFEKVEKIRQNYKVSV